MSTTASRSLEAYLREAARRHRLLLGYVIAGFPHDWLELVEAMIDAGADAIEIGIPFSDSAIDGTTIQEASVLALNSGMTPARCLRELRRREFGVPLIAMTHYNLVYRYGHERFAADLASAGGWGSIVVDLPMEYAAEWLDAARRENIENVLLVAPSTSDERLQRIADNAGGFIYVVSTMGTTGGRDCVDDAAAELACRIKKVSDFPAVVGFGISNAETAVTAAAQADGVIVASALMRLLLDGASIEDAERLMSEVRCGLDAAYPPHERAGMPGLT